ITAGSALQRGIKPVLRAQAIPLVRPFQTGANDAPVTTLTGDGVFDVERAKGAEEGAKAEMNDAGLQLAAVVARSGDGRRQAVDRGGRQTFQGRINGQASLRPPG